MQSKKPTIRSQEQLERRQQHPERVLMRELISLTRQISRANYEEARKLFELTKASTYPRLIAELAEAFGMMIVKVESREFKLEQVIEDLDRSCKELIVAKKKLQAFNRTLEKKVLARTEQLRGKNDELSKAHEELKKENKERRLAEKNLKRLNQQIEVTNQKLQDAYLWMRQKKNELEERKYKESILFLIADDGRICGFTEQARDLTKKSSVSLQDGSNILDFLVPQGGQALPDLIRQVRPRMSHLAAFRIKDQPESEPIYEAKLTRIGIEGKGLVYVVLYPRTGQ